MKLDHSRYANPHSINKNDYRTKRVYNRKTNELIYEDLSKVKNVKLDGNAYIIKEEFDSVKYGKAVTKFNEITNNKYKKFYNDLIKAYDVENNEKSKLLFDKAVSNVGAISKTKEIELFFSDFVDLIK